MTGILRVPRRAALAAVSVLVAAASVASLAESYRGLYLWAHHHGLSGVWVAMFPLQVDTFLVVGELTLFVALVDRWPPRSRVAAWAVTVAGLAISVAGNVGHISGHSVTARATAAIPPMAAAAALAVGLGVLKRVVASRPRGQGDAPVKRPAKPSRPPAKRGHGHRSQADTEAAALASLATNPAMTAKELSAAIGVSDRTARRVRARLAAPDTST